MEKYSCINPKYNFQKKTSYSPSAAHLNPILNKGVSAVLGALKITVKLLLYVGANRNKPYRIISLATVSDIQYLFLFSIA